MTDQIDQKRSKIPLKRFLADYREGVPDREIMQKYGLSARSMVTLVKTLLDKKALTAEDLTRRKQKTEKIELVKESQFLKSLYICPNCGHPHPQQFDRCPACGANPDDYTAPEQIVDDVTTTGGHFYVDDITTFVGDAPTGEPLTEPEPLPEEQPTEQATVTPAAPEKPPPQPRPQEVKEEAVEEPKEESKEKGSPFKSVRALLSRIKKS